MHGLSDPKKGKEKDESQPSLQDLYSNLRAYDINDDKAQKIHALILDLFIKDLLPFDLVQGEAMKALLHYLEPRFFLFFFPSFHFMIYKKFSNRYQLPSRNYFSQTLLGRAYHPKKREIENLLIQAQTLALTADGWSAIGNEG